MADEDEAWGDASVLTAGYERLRAAVLSARGMTGWMSAFGELAAPVVGGTGATTGPAPRSSADSCDAPNAQTVSLPGADQVVQVLAQMVLPLAA